MTCSKTSSPPSNFFKNNIIDHINFVSKRKILLKNSSIYSPSFKPIKIVKKSLLGGGNKY